MLIALTFAARSTTAISIGLLSLLLARTLGPADLGRFLFLYSVISVISIIGRMGLDTAIMKRSGEMRGTDPVLQRDLFFGSVIAVNAFCIVLALVLNLIYYAFRSSLSDLIGPSSMVVLSLLLLVYSTNHILAANLKVVGKSFLAPFFERGGAELLTLIAAALAWLRNIRPTLLETEQAFLLLSAVLAVAGLTYTTRIFSVRCTHRADVPQVARRIVLLVRESNDFLLTSLVSHVTGRGLPFVLGLSFPAYIVGLFGVIYNVSAAVAFALLVYSAILPPQFAYLWRVNRINELKQLYVRSIREMLLVSVPIAVGILLLGKYILAFSGFDYTLSISLALTLIVAAQLFNVYAGPVGFLLNMCDRQRDVRNVTIATGLLMLATVAASSRFGGILVLSAIVALNIALKNNWFLSRARSLWAPVAPDATAEALT